MKKIKSVPAIGIMNKYGELWSAKTFHNEVEAANYLKSFWGETKYNAKDYKFIPVRVTPLPQPKRRAAKRKL